MTVLSIGIILLTSSFVAMLSRRLNLPYSTGLVAAGILLGFFPAGLDVPLSRELVFTAFLPPLIFEAALQLEWPAFRRELPATLLLAFPGVAIAAAAVGVGMHFLLGWSWAGAGLFGILIAATDPVSVIAAFKELKVESRLSLLVESESLLNDGAAAVGFTILMGLAGAASPTVAGGIVSFVWTVAGGIIVGVVVAGAMLLIAGRTSDHLVEITLTTIAAYGSFLFAEYFGMSGVLAALAAGLVVGNIGRRGAISEGGRPHVLAFWQYVAFLANSAIFILIGAHESHQPFGLFSVAAAIGIGLVLLGRVMAVYPLSLLLAPTGLRIPLAYQHVLFWGGLRGALALALSLAVPTSLPERREIIVTAFAVVAFSVFVQGLTMPWVIHRLGFGKSRARKAP